MCRTWRPWFSQTSTNRLWNMVTVPRINPSCGPALSLSSIHNSVLMPPKLTGSADHPVNCCFSPRIMMPRAAAALRGTNWPLKEGSVGISTPYPRWSVSSPGHEAQFKKKSKTGQCWGQIRSPLWFCYSKVPSWTYTFSLFKRKSYKNW